MKLCVTSSGKDIDSLIDEHFGRAPYFLIVDTETMEFKVLENTAQATGRGAGISAAQMVLDSGAAAVFTGIIGPNAFDALRIAHMDIYEGLSVHDTVKDAVDKFNKGEYRDVTEPTGGPGYGRGFRGGR